jgi:glycosyltransferase involved in cell wall biosynthesis
MFDVVCFSHLRWHFVFQRPQHLLTRCARTHRVFFIEEAIHADAEMHLASSHGGENVEVLTPIIPNGLTREEAERMQAELVQRALAERAVDRYVLWFYTPMAVCLARNLSPLAVIYDCMDELSAFKGADPALLSRERELLANANVVFTGGHSLFEAKRGRHANVHSFPSSVDVGHFGRARNAESDPEDQAAVPRPRFGFCGVVDERMDLTLLEGVAAARPDWHFVIIGPVVKIDEADLPRLPNLHYLGPKQYEELPSYIAGWDVAILPFARNESTRFISPTKTPEYLAAGKPVVSTSITDVVRTYGQAGYCHIADDVTGFIAACEKALLEKDDELRLRKVDELLSQSSWDQTWAQMESCVAAVTRAPQRPMAMPSTSRSRSEPWSGT